MSTITKMNERIDQLESEKEQLEEQYYGIETANPTHWAGWNYYHRYQDILTEIAALSDQIEFYFD